MSLYTAHWSQLIHDKEEHLVYPGGDRDTPTTSQRREEESELTSASPHTRLNLEQ